MIERLLLVGVGLMGASAGLAVKQRGLAREVVGFSRRKQTLEEARRIGAIDSFETDLEAAAKGADFVLVSVPVDAVASRVRELAVCALADGAVITDVGSVKESICAQVETDEKAAARFVGGHPIAGTEKSGPAAAIETLYEGRHCILTPGGKNNPAATQKVRAFWEALGMQVEQMEPAHHDEVLAMISHLPHVVAYALVGAVAAYDREHPALKFTAGGFKDFTRIAASAPGLWRAIIEANRRASLDSIARFKAELEQMEAAIEAGDFAKLEELFTRAATVRRELEE